MANFKLKSKFNIEVNKVFLGLLISMKFLISSIKEDTLRGVLVRQDKPNKTDGYIVYELINPLLYLRLECNNDKLFTIHYGYEQSELVSQYYPITSAFIRSIYRYTSKENTSVDIENCVQTDWIITNCAELFEYIMDRNKFHQYSVKDYFKEAA